MPNRTDQQPTHYTWLLPLMTLGLMTGIVLARKAETWQGAAIAASLSLLASLLLPGQRRIAALMLLSACTGALLTIHAAHPSLPDEGRYTVSGVVMDEPLTEDGDRLRTRLDSVTLDGTPLSGDAWWTVYLTPDEPLPEWLVPGARVTFTAQVYHPGGESNPGGYNFRESLLQDGIVIGVYGMADLTPGPQSAGLSGLLAGLRHTLAGELRRVMGAEEGGLAAAMLLGEKDYLDPEDVSAFRELGISHILSVSGYHVGVLALLLSLLLTPMELPRVLRVMLLSAALMLYALLTGAAPPVIRAGLLLFLREMGQMQQRRNSPLHLLCLSAACQLLFNPLQLFSPSFQLTYCAMLGLVLVYPRLQSAHEFRHSCSRWLWKGFSASLAVQLGLLPAQMYWFGSIPLISLALNVFILALSSGVMALYWLTLILLPIPFVREGLGALTGFLTRWMLAGIRGLAGVAGYSLWVPAANIVTVLGWALIMLGLSVLIRRNQPLLRRVLAVSGSCLIVLSLLSPPHAGTYWLQFSCGEADAALLHDRDAVILVDVGEDSHTVAGYLHRRRLPVDALILTHLHIDHAGGIEGLLDQGIPVRRCYLPEGAYLAGDADEEAALLLTRLEATGTEIVFLSRGDVITTPSGQLTVLWPQEGTLRPGQAANDICLVLRAEIRGTTMLLASDLTSRYEMYAAIPADILKAAHHGSAESSSPAFIQAVSPQLILLSCGTEEREAAFLPRAGNVPVCSTNAAGAVTIRFTEDAFTVETHLPR